MLGFYARHHHQILPKSLHLLTFHQQHIRGLITLHTNTMVVLMFCELNACVTGPRHLLQFITLCMILLSVRCSDWIMPTFPYSVHSFVPITVVLLLSFFVLSYSIFSSKFLEFGSLLLPSVSCAFLIFHLCFKNVHSCSVEHLQDSCFKILIW